MLRPSILLIHGDRFASSSRVHICPPLYLTQDLFGANNVGLFLRRSGHCMTNSHVAHSKGKISECIFTTRHICSFASVLPTDPQRSSRSIIYQPSSLAHTLQVIVASGLKNSVPPRHSPVSSFGPTDGMRHYPHHGEALTIEPHLLDTNPPVMPMTSSQCQVPCRNTLLSPRLFVTIYLVGTLEARKLTVGMFGSLLSWWVSSVNVNLERIS